MITAGLVHAVCANINDAMQKFIGISYETNHQHKEVFKARQITDIKDTLALIRYLKERDPFTQNAFLFNIANGVTALENVDVDSAQVIGNNILKSMVDKSVEDYTFRKLMKQSHLLQDQPSRSKEYQ